MSTQEITKTKQETLAQWLRDAHAMEEQALTMLDGLARRLEHYPELKARIVQHYKETESQEKKLKSCIDRYGGTSAVKVAVGKVMGMMQSLSGVLASDEVIKGAMFSYAFEHFEISAYRTLIGAAEEVGDLETKRVCEEVLREEEAMAAWLADHLPTVTRQYLEREALGVDAKR